MNEQDETPKLNRVGSVMLVLLGSACYYALFMYIAAHCFDSHVRLLPSHYIIIGAALLWAGVRLWQAWRTVMAWIWLFFAGLAVCNSFVYRRLGSRSDIPIADHEGLAHFGSIMSKAAWVMAAISLSIGILFFLLHRLHLKALPREAVCEETI